METALLYPPSELKAQAVQRNINGWEKLVDSWSTVLKHTAALVAVASEQHRTEIDRLLQFSRSYILCQSGLQLQFEPNLKGSYLAAYRKKEREFGDLVLRIVLYLHKSSFFPDLEEPELSWHFLRTFYSRGTPVLSIMRSASKRHPLTHVILQRLTGNIFDSKDIAACAALLADAEIQALLASSQFFRELESAELPKSELSVEGENPEVAVIRLYLLIVLSLEPPAVASLLTEIGIHNYRELRSSAFPRLAIAMCHRIFLEEGPEEVTKRYCVPPRLLAVSREDISALQDLFPQLSPAKAEEILLDNGNELESATNFLLEHPEEADAPVKAARKSQYDDDGLSRLDFSQVRVLNTGKDGKERREKSLGDGNNNADVKAKSLEVTLRLLYQADDDERDDTYDEAEAYVSNEVAMQSRGRTRIRAAPEPTGDEDEPENEKSEATVEREKRELFLWLEFKTDPSAFTKQQRGTPKRHKLIAETHLNNDELEAWARMIQQEPEKARALQSLEQDYVDYVMSHSQRTIVGSYDLGLSERERGEKNRQKAGEKGGNRTGPGKQRNGPSGPSGPSGKPAARNKTKNKATGGNHNRKAGHAKKMARAGM